MFAATYPITGNIWTYNSFNEKEKSNCLYCTFGNLVRPRACDVTSATVNRFGHHNNNSKSSRYSNSSESSNSNSPVVVAVTVTVTVAVTAALTVTVAVTTVVTVTVE